jgi:hypothetical protein
MIARNSIGLVKVMAVDANALRITYPKLKEGFALCKIISRSVGFISQGLPWLDYDVLVIIAKRFCA